MANVLNTDKQIAIVGALAEGSSIRAAAIMQELQELRVNAEPEAEA